jgi:hypothetical protein
MLISGADAIVFSDNEAYTNKYRYGIRTTLFLAMQRSSRASGADCWKAELHQTTPRGALTQKRRAL